MLIASLSVVFGAASPRNVRLWQSVAGLSRVKSFIIEPGVLQSHVIALVVTTISVLGADSSLNVN